MVGRNLWEGACGDARRLWSQRRIAVSSGTAGLAGRRIYAEYVVNEAYAADDCAFIDVASPPAFHANWLRRMIRTACWRAGLGFDLTPK